MFTSLLARCQLDMVSERIRSFFSLLQHPRNCSVDLGTGTEARIAIDATTTYSDVLNEACDRDDVQSREYCLVTADDGKGLRPRDIVTCYALRRLPRDKCGGSDKGAGTIHRWDRETAQHVITQLESCTQPGYERLRMFWSMVNQESEHGKLILNAVHAVMKESFDKIKEIYYANMTEDYLKKRSEEYLRWKAIKVNLERLLPEQSALAPVDSLRRMRKDPRESLLDFIRRFRATAQVYHSEGKITEREATHLLVQKLPTDFVYHMSGTDFANITIDNLEKRAKNVVDFMRLQATQCKPVVPIGEYMDLQTAALMVGQTAGGTTDCETAYAVRSRLTRDGKLQFPLTAETPNVVMVAFKKLIKGNLRYLEEAERAIKAERERRAKGLRSVVNAAVEDLHLEDEESAGACNQISCEGESDLPPWCVSSHSLRENHRFTQR